MFSGLAEDSGGLEALGWDVVFACTGAAAMAALAPEVVDFAVAAGKYHITPCRHSGNALAHLLWPTVLGTSWSSLLRFAVCCGMRAACRGEEAGMSCGASRTKALIVQRLQ